VSALDLIAWPAVYARLLDCANDRVIEAAAWHADRASGELLSREHVTFAVLAEQEWRLRLDFLLGLPATEDLARDWFEQRSQVAGWLQATAHLVVALSSSIADPGPVSPPRPGGLLVEPELQPLPHLELAREWAALPWIGGLLVVARRLPPTVAGRYGRGLVELDPEKADSREALERTWRHELGHALDVNGWGGSEAGELFADELAALLAEHEPAAIAELEPLWQQAVAAVNAHPRFRPAAELQPDASTAAQVAVELPAPGQASLLAFLALPLAEPAEVAA
jgi:hypothetical protein